MTYTLDLLPQTAYAFMLIFARVGTMIMLLPGLGDQGVPTRLRLVFALAVTFVMYPALAGLFSAVPDGPYDAIKALVREIVIGGFFGMSVRLILSALTVAGAIIAMQTGLAFAQSVDPAQGIQSAIFASFLSVLAVTLILVTDLHHLMIAGIHNSYSLFAPGRDIPVGDFAMMAVNTVSSSFRVAMQLSAPFMAFGLIFYLGLGVLSRLMPQVQIFFLAIPLNIVIGFILFMLLLTAMSAWFIAHFETTVSGFLT